LDADDTAAEFGSFEDRLPDVDHLRTVRRGTKEDAERFAEAFLTAFPRDARKNAVGITLDASLTAASLVRARTPETAVAAASLASLVDRVAFSGNERGLAAVVDAAVCALRRVAGLETEPTESLTKSLTVPAGAALAALARFALPAEPEDDAPASFPLRLSKAPTQEEFIRGRMTKNPYDSLAIRAETMRDVKNFVCASLDMHGLCDDDYGMELLVAGRIVALDLTVREAYDGVWRLRRGGAAESGPGLAREPMDVTYRLTGLDGDATEEIVSSVALDDEDDADETDPEEVFRNANLVRAARGLEALLACAPLLSDGGARLGSREKTNDDELSSRSSHDGFDLRRATTRRAETSACFLRVLSGVARVEKNRRALLALNAIPVLLAEASRAFSVAERLDADEARERGVETLLLVERLLGEETAVAAEDANGFATRSGSRSSTPTPRAQMGQIGGLTRSLSAAFDDAGRDDASREERLETRRETPVASAAIVPRVSKSPPPFGSFGSFGSSLDELDAFETDTARVNASSASPHSAAARHTRVFLGTLAELCAAPAAEGAGRGAARGGGRGSTKRRDAAASTLARVLPRLAAHDATAAEALAAHVARAFERLKELDGAPERTDGCSDPSADDDGGATKTRGSSSASSPLALELRCCALVAEGIAADDAGARLKRRLLRRGALAAVTSYLLDVAFAGEGAAELDKSSEGWSRACARPALAPALAALRGLVEAHAEASAGARDATGGGSPDERRLLPLLHALESVARDGVGTLAETALEAAAAADASGATRDELEALRAETRRVNARRAMEQRERTLRSMGMARVPASPPRSSDLVTRNAASPGSHAASSLGTSPGEYIAVVASPSSMRGVELEVADDDDDDDDAPAPACRVCREGYASRPAELLGVYAFCAETRTRSDASPSLGGRREKTFSSVSHFNAIHFSCHDAARRADAALKTPKREWEGASLRNGETLANNLLPLAAGRHCAVPADALAAAAEQWWERLAEIGGAKESRERVASGSEWRAGGSVLGTSAPSKNVDGEIGSRLRAALADVAALLGRFAVRADFASGARGGGRRSNARFVPALLALAAGELARARARAWRGASAARARRRTTTPRADRVVSSSAPRRVRRRTRSARLTRCSPAASRVLREATRRSPQRSCCRFL
jgi:E3 ubiquitin-protein ligase UBR4